MLFHENEFFGVTYTIRHHDYFSQCVIASIQLHSAIAATEAYGYEWSDDDTTVPQNAFRAPPSDKTREDMTACWAHVVVLGCKCSGHVSVLSILPCPHCLVLITFETVAQASGGQRG